MADTQALIAEIYSAFNRRDVEASEGGRVTGKEEIRAYWGRQWKEFDPHVEPLEVIERGAGNVDVRVHQVVKSLGGDVLSDGEVWHAYTIVDGLIERMDLGDSEAGSGQSASSAFRHQPA